MDIKTFKYFIWQLLQQLIKHLNYFKLYCYIQYNLQLQCL